MPPPPPPKKKNTIWIIIGVIVALLLLCGLINNAAHTQSSTTSTTSDVQPTDTFISDTPTIAPTSGPSINIAPVTGPAIIGAKIGTLVARYGEPQDQLDGYNYEFKDGNGKIYLSVFVEQGRVQGLIYNPITTEDWTPAQGKAACLGFAPPDSQYQRKYDLLDAANALIGTEFVYYSASLASKFPAKDFVDEHGNPTTAGIFGMQLVYDTSLNDTSKILECSIAVGLDANNQ